MGFQISPGVQFTEKDATGIIPAVSTTDGAYAGIFRWGPLNDITLVGTETELANKFGTPDITHRTSFYSCANFLAYGDKLRVVRTADTTSKISRTFTVASVDLDNNKIVFVESLDETVDSQTGATLPAVKRLDKIDAGVVGAEDMIVLQVEDEYTVEIRPKADGSSPIPSVLAEDDSVVIKCFAGAANATADGLGAIIKNDDDYQNNYGQAQANVGPFAAKHPGVLGNSLRISVCASATAHKSELTDKFSTDGSDKEWILATGSAFKAVLGINSYVKNAATGEEKVVVAIHATQNKFKVDSSFSSDLSTSTLVGRWEFSDLFSAPGTSVHAADKGAKKDEIHLVVVDENGEFTGTPGYVLERYQFLSKASDARLDGDSNYYKDVVNNKSKYVRWTDHPVFGGNLTGSEWGVAAVRNREFDSSTKPLSIDLAGGVDGSLSAGVEAARTEGYSMFADADKVDVSLVIMGEATAGLCIHVINNVCERRLDCVAFISPPRSAVVGNPGNEVEAAIAFRTLLPSTSYAVLDSGWKKQFDKYNPTSQDMWVPLNPDVAGLCVRTDTNQDPWWSPAGFNRGGIKNALKLAYSPYKAERDDLYKNNINPVIDQPGEGRVLFGDKTMLTKPSAFDRINVRRLFIVLEKAISRAAKYMLFEFNDEFTRQQFRSMVEPILRDVQSRRGMYDFRVVCDRTNNTSEVIDRNEFVGDIYIKPARSINFIQLNFIAVRTGVEFSEIVGKI